MCGFPISEYLFVGFLPVKGKDRTERISRLAQFDETVVLYEAPHRVGLTFREMAAEPMLTNRRCAVCRELTKLHETVFRGTIGEYSMLLEDSRGSQVRFSLCCRT